MEKYEELKKMEVHNNEYRAEIKKVKICLSAVAKLYVLVDWAVGWKVTGVMFNDRKMGFKEPLGIRK